MPTWEPSVKAIRSLVELLPELEKTPTTAWEGGQPNEEGVIAMPYLLPDEVEAEFMDRAYEDGWVYDFDWGEWQGEAERYHREPGLLVSADVDTIRKLITTHVRKDRFCEGHFRAMREEGHLAAIVKRLAQFRSAASDGRRGKGR